MKILHIITCIDDAGGAEKLMEDLLPGLKREGCDVSCLVFYGFDSKNRKTLEKEGVKVYELSRNKHYYNPIKIVKLIPYIWKYDIIHTHNTPAVIFTALANIFGRSKLVTTIHSTGGRMRENKALRIFERWILNRYSTIICCSKAAEISLIKDICPKARIITINNGIKLEKLKNAKPLNDIKNDCIKNIIMVAWFREPKMHKTVIDAMCRLAPFFHLYFVGAGEKMKECIEYAKKNGVIDRVHFMGLRTDVPSILKAADYIVLSSHYEGLSLSSVEGMSVGKPFIASDVNGLREIVDGAGILFPDGDSERLANIIMELEENPKLYKDISNKCFERAMQYDISSMINGYKKVYMKLIKE